MTNSFYHPGMTISEAMKRVREDVDFACDIISSYRKFDWLVTIENPKEEAYELLFKSLIDKHMTQAFHLSGVPKHIVACWDPRTIGNPGSGAPFEVIGMWVLGDSRNCTFMNLSVMFFEDGHVDFQNEISGSCIHSNSLSSLFRTAFGEDYVDNSTSRRV